MRTEEIELVETRVASDLMPEIRAAIPSILGFILKKIFPKIEQKIIVFVIQVVTIILAKREKTN